MMFVRKPEKLQRAWRGLWVMGGLAVVVAGIFGTERGARGAERDFSVLGGVANVGGVAAKNGQTGKASIVSPDSALKGAPEGKGLADRAFWGAPPPMPHRFGSEWDASRCLTCHAQKTDLSKRHQAISPIPHAVLSQCQQCHVRVPERSEASFVLSEFIGLAAPGKGSRAHSVAPPTIPHQTFMRSNCLSCHGPGGEQRIATPHPYRSQCRQCHVSDVSREYTRAGLR